MFPHPVTATEGSHLVARERKDKTTRKTLWIRVIHRESQSLACPWGTQSDWSLLVLRYTQHREAELRPRIGRAAPLPQAGAQPLPQTGAHPDSLTAPQIPHSTAGANTEVLVLPGAKLAETFTVYKILRVFWKCDPALPMQRTQNSSKLLPL